MADDVFAALDSVFNGCNAAKLQSWSCKVANATSAAQVELDMQHKCRCSTPCHKTFTDSYATVKECQEALLQLRVERTTDKAADERAWLFNYLYNNRSRSGGEITVLFRVDGVNVCEEYFTTALGFNFPNRRIQHIVRLIKVKLNVTCYMQYNVNAYLLCNICISGRAHASECTSVSRGAVQKPNLARFVCASLDPGVFLNSG